MLDIVRKLHRSRHACATDQNRDNANALLQRGFNFNSYRVSCVENLSITWRAEPFGPDDGDHNVAAPNRLRDMLSKVDSKRNIVDIHIDGTVAKLVC